MWLAFPFSATGNRLVNFLEHLPRLWLEKGPEVRIYWLVNVGCSPGQLKSLLFLVFFLIVLLNWELDDGGAAVVFLLPVSKILTG